MANSNLERYLEAILAAIDSGEELSIPRPSWNYEKYLAAIVQALRDHDPADPEVVEEFVNAWLDDHPEATTTVEDGAVTTPKIADSAVTDAKLAASGVKSDVADLKSAIIIGGGFTYTKSTGYISSDGTIASASGNNEVYTSLIPIHYGLKIYFKLAHSTIRGNWCALALYNSDQKFLGRNAFISNVNAKSVDKIITFDAALSNAIYNAAYVAFTWRAFTDGVETIVMDDISGQLGDIVAVKPRSFVKGVNHKGYHTYAPENNVLAYKQSAIHGFKYAETDVRFTSDGIAVCIHDESINYVARNADGTSISSTVNIHDITYEQAQAYDFGIVKGSAYAGTKISTLAQVLSVCRALGIHLYVEIKYDAAYTEAQIKGLVELVNEYGMLHNVSWISSYYTYLTYIHAKAPAARLGLVAETLTETHITNMLAVYEDNEVFIDQSTSYMTSNSIALCKGAGIPLEAWTVNTKEAIIALDQYVSGVTSDHFDAEDVLGENTLS